jgi:protocatechuate 3,4-dioxygenase beta subunit
MNRNITASMLALFLTASPNLSDAQTSPPPRPGDAGRMLATTPSQTEGPYYPVDKLADRDNDLTRVGEGGRARGTPLVLSGKLVNQRNTPINAARIEIWQADDGGAYMHPNDSKTQQRDKAFQFYGEATTDGDGLFSFRTIMPGLYGDRPRHIHLKVVPKAGASLTTQLYFAGDERLGRDFLTRRLGDRLSALLVDARPKGNGDFLGNVLLVVDAR